MGWGSLRNNGLLIPNLGRCGYVGIEPNEWLLKEGMGNETGEDIIRLKDARFSYQTDCRELGSDERLDWVHQTNLSFDKAFQKLRKPRY